MPSPLPFCVHFIRISQYCSKLHEHVDYFFFVDIPMLWPFWNCNARWLHINKGEIAWTDICLTIVLLILLLLSWGQIYIFGRLNRGFGIIRRLLLTLLCHNSVQTTAFRRPLFVCHLASRAMLHFLLLPQAFFPSKEILSFFFCQFAILW